MPDPPYSPNLAAGDLYLFPTVKNSNGFSWLTRTSFLGACKRFWGYRSTKIEYRISDSCVPNSRSKWRQRRLRQMINKFYILILLDFVRQGWRMYLSTRWYFCAFISHETFWYHNGLCRNWTWLRSVSRRHLQWRMRPPTIVQKSAPQSSTSQ
jgi:hypothetical protein